MKCAVGYNVVADVEHPLVPDAVLAKFSCDRANGGDQDRQAEGKEENRRNINRRRSSNLKKPAGHRNGEEPCQCTKNNEDEEVQQVSR